MQILWERGFIDPNIPISEVESRYPVGGQKDNLGQVIPGTAMKEILANLPDFAERRLYSNGTQKKGQRLIVK